MSSPDSRHLAATILALLVTAAAFGEMAPLPVADNVQKSDCRIWVKRFDPFSLEWRGDSTPPAASGARSIRCVTRVEDGGRPRKGAKVRLSAELTGPGGNVVSLGARSAKTDRGGVAAIEFPIAGLPAGESFTARVEGRYASWKKATTVTTDCGPSAR